MHYHLEIVMPPVANVDEAVREVMKPFDEQGADEEGLRNRHGFYDWYVIGGRWSGEKLTCALDPKLKELFFEELNSRGVTVSGLRTGKERLEPASQAPAVDALWRQMFPDWPFQSCPYFDHFNDQYKDSKGFPDVMPLKDVPKGLTAERVILAAPKWGDPKAIAAECMVQRTAYNGLSFIDTVWDGKFSSALVFFQEKIRRYSEEFIARCTPKDDWLTVTVDYHT